jgi:hypothetical protein
LEPTKNNYDFSKITEDIATSISHGKVMSFLVQYSKGADWIDHGLPDYILTDPEYEGGDFENVNQPGVYLPKLWLSALGDRMVALIQALGAAFDGNPAISMYTFPETSNTLQQLQPGFTSEGFLSYLKRTQLAAHTAFPTTLIVQTVNWRSGLSEEQADEMMEHLVYTCKGGFGATDIIEPDEGTTPFDTAFGKYYEPYRGIAAVVQKAETPTYSSQTAQIQFDFAVDTMQANYIIWHPFLNYTGTSAFSFNEVIAVVNAEKGRINTNIPSNLY